MAGGVSVLDESIDHVVACVLGPAKNLRRSEVARVGVRRVLLVAGTPYDKEAVISVDGPSASARGGESPLACPVGAASTVVPDQRIAVPAGARGSRACA